MRYIGLISRAFIFKGFVTNDLGGGIECWYMLEKTTAKLYNDLNLKRYTKKSNKTATPVCNQSSVMVDGP